MDTTTTTTTTASAAVVVARVAPVGYTMSELIARMERARYERKRKRRVSTLAALAAAVAIDTGQGSCIAAVRIAERAIGVLCARTSRPRLALATALVEVNLTRSGLTRLPNCLAVSASTIERIDLHDNRLRALPGWLAKFTRLCTLDVSHNRLGMLPVHLRELTSLQDLSLAYNLLPTIPLWLGELVNLRYLNLCSALANGAEPPAAMWESFARLTRLHTLRACHINSRDENTASAPMPRAIYALTRLRQLTLDNTGVSCVERDITRLARLTHLSGLEGMTAIAPHIGRLARLESFDEFNAHVDTIPHEFVSLLDRCDDAYFLRVISSPRSAAGDAAWSPQRNLPSLVDLCFACLVAMSYPATDDSDDSSSSGDDDSNDHGDDDDDERPISWPQPHWGKWRTRPYANKNMTEKGSDDGYDDDDDSDDGKFTYPIGAAMRAHLPLDLCDYARDRWSRTCALCLVPIVGVPPLVRVTMEHLPHVNQQEWISSLLPVERALCVHCAARESV